MGVQGCVQGQKGTVWVSLHSYRCAGCEAKSRIWTLVGSCDNQHIVAVADLKVQFFYCRNPPLNAHTCRQLI